MPAKEATFSENSRSSYRQFLDRHILPVLGDLPIKDISSAMLTKLLLEFQKGGKAHSSAVKLFNILNGIFKMAFLDGSIDENPIVWQIYDKNILYINSNIRIIWNSNCKINKLNRNINARKFQCITDLQFIRSCFLEMIRVKWIEYKQDIYNSDHTSDSQSPYKV